MLHFCFLFVLATYSHTLSADPARVSVYFQDAADPVAMKPMEQAAGKFLSQLKMATLTRKSPQWTKAGVHPSAVSGLQKLWQTSALEPIDSVYLVMAAKRTDGLFELRPVPVKVKATGAYEEAVIVMDAQGTIMDFLFTIDLHRYTKLAEGRDVTDSGIRQQILGFLDEYRTAYNRKNLPFIKDVFSDNALIIVGKMVQKERVEGGFVKQVEYLRLNKLEFVDRLQKIFAKNTWIEVNFSKINIMEHPAHPRLYGINLTQEYRSSTYSDIGYLFLLMDFRNPQKPMIHVRTWQPVNAISEKDAFSLGDLEIF